MEVLMDVQEIDEGALEAALKDGKDATLHLNGWVFASTVVEVKS